jgi:hypothetical protein
MQAQPCPNGGKQVRDGYAPTFSLTKQQRRFALRSRTTRLRDLEQLEISNPAAAKEMESPTDTILSNGPHGAEQKTPVRQTIRQPK